ncbi:unnamed protein product [Macrosiphum euphorbiae]|uniref:CCHC-type domain-containing protein n=1 Tax=Macrosiphum euphorbiae TaxID=13131 RepID=A0AAV0VSM2_9HEMI|nr:unnamed protein product [Macrosiphum euphorbiae]
MNKTIKTPSSCGESTSNSTQHKMSIQNKISKPKSNMPPSPNQSTENLISDTSKNMDNNLPQQNIATQKKTFAESLNPNPFPKKDQAIIFDIENEEIQLKDYIIEIGKITKPENIIFVSKISKKRMCIFLSTKDLANKLIQDNENLVVQGQNIKLRKLYNPDKRIILANVYPNIPHAIIIEALKEHNITPTSPISFLRAGIHIEGLTHILSFRRQMYISPEDENKIPSSILINFENANYRVFLSNDELTCFLCKKIGHTSNNCPKANELKPTDTNIISPLPNSQTQIELDETEPKTPIHLESEIDFYEPMDQSQTDDKVQQIETKPLPNTKRSASTQSPTLSASTISNKVTPAPNQTKTQKTNPTKKTKITPATENFVENIDTHLLPIKSFFVNNKELPINYPQFRDIIEKVQINPDPDFIFEQYNISLKAMIDLIEKVRPKLQSNSSKIRFTRLHNELFNKYLDKQLKPNTQN